MKNIVRLARIFDRFIELDSSFVLVDDIRAIRKCSRPAEANPEELWKEGIEVVTPYGAFFDSTDFDIFKIRIADTIEALRGKDSNSSSPVERKVMPIQNPGEHKSIEPPMPVSPSKPNPLPAEFPITEERAQVTLSGNGSTGKLFQDKNLKVVNRERLVILDSEGSVISKGSSGGTVVGETISGIVYENGNYTLSAKKFSGNKVVVVYNVQRGR